jgi:hypothetical protein
MNILGRIVAFTIELVFALIFATAMITMVMNLIN